MRLLHLDSYGELGLTEDLIDNIPNYAILSHTWGKDYEEVTFDDISNGLANTKVGYQKVQFCREQAEKDCLNYFWVDTCCINRSNQAELSEALISMFRWYRRAERCYVYLSDVSARKRNYEGHEAPTTRTWEPAFRKSRWFTRGWTLQELLAPSSVSFFSQEGEFLDNKTALAELIRDITGIPISALHGAPLSQFSIEERLRWAAGRDTKRVEDKWYCLQGIFDVFMAPLYGEGENAFVRLKDQISRSYRAHLDGIGQDILPSNLAQSGNVGVGTASITAKEVSTHDFRKEFLSCLSFDRMEARRSTIKSAYSTTCQWFLKHHSYLDWIDPSKIHQHNGFLWIIGKPGAGKSTLVKFASEHSNSQRVEDELLLSFFFNARGDEFEKSTIGMYRSLLSQLLAKAVDLQNVLDNFRPSVLHQGNFPTWTLELLRECLSLAVESLRRRQLKFFIDALDECEEQQIREMITFFDELGQKALKNGDRLYVCFASRHYPAIDIRTGLRLVLEDEQGHGEDLSKYVQHHLRAGRGKYIEEVRRHIQEKANGVFMWAVLVVDILNKEFLSGRIFAVKKRLQEIPMELSELFKDIVRRDSANMNDLLLCLQWVLFAKRPLKREEFYFAMVAGLDPEQENLTEWNPEHVTPEDMNRFILNSSKGLAELTKAKTPTVQFIHESVRDFLLKDNGLYELWPNLRDIASSSHDHLKQCCQTYLAIDISGHLTSDEISLKASSDSAKDLRKTLRNKFPFLEYASRYVLEHSNQAGKVVPQDDFLKGFDLEAWLSITNLLERFEIRRYTSEASLLYILAENNLAQLVRTVGPDTSDFHKRGERHYYPLFAALANGHRDAVRALFETVHDSLLGDLTRNLEFGRAFSAPKDCGPLLWALKKGNPIVAEAILKFPDVSHHLTHHELSNSLSQAARNGYERVVDLLLTVSGIHADILDKIQRTPLSYAAEQGQTSIIRLLLDKGADTEVLSSTWTALQWAVIGGQEQTLQQLTDSDANIEAQSIDGMTALILAAAHGYERIVQRLADLGANLEATDYKGRTALLLAALNGHEGTVRHLLQLGARIEAADYDGCTALLLATKNRHVTTVRQLIQQGAFVEAADRNGRTTLSHASQLRDKNIVSLLLANNASVTSKDKVGTPALFWAIGSQKGGLGDYQLQLMLLEKQNKKRLMMARRVIDDMQSQQTEMGAQLIPGNPSANVDSTALASLPTDFENVLHLLLANGASIDATGPGGKTALMVAVESRDHESLEVLLRSGASIDVTSPSGKTALMIATERGDHESLEMLVRSGASIDAASYSGKPALMVATERGDYESLEVLLRSGASIDAASPGGTTALMVAARRGNHESLEILLRNGANLEARDASGNTALLLAAKRMDVVAVRRLLDENADTEAKDNEGRTVSSYISKES